MIKKYFRQKISFLFLITISISFLLLNGMNHIEVYKKYTESVWKNNYSFILESTSKNISNYIQLNKNIKPFNESLREALIFYIKSFSLLDSYTTFFFYETQENDLINDSFIDQFRDRIYYKLENDPSGIIKMSTIDDYLILTKKFMLPENKTVLLGILITQSDLIEYSNIYLFINREINNILFFGIFIILLILYDYYLYVENEG